MPEDIFEKQLETAQKKIGRKQRKTVKQIEAEIEEIVDEWIGLILEDMEATIAKEPDKKKADEMDTMMVNYLEGFAHGFRMGWLKERVEYEQD